MEHNGVTLKKATALALFLQPLAKTWASLVLRSTSKVSILISLSNISYFPFLLHTIAVSSAFPHVALSWLHMWTLAPLILLNCLNCFPFSCRAVQLLAVWAAAPTGINQTAGGHIEDYRLGLTGCLCAELAATEKIFHASCVPESHRSRRRKEQSPRLLPLPTPLTHPQPPDKGTKSWS